MWIWSRLTGRIRLLSDCIAHTIHFDVSSRSSRMPLGYVQEEYRGFPLLVLIAGPMLHAYAIPHYLFHINDA